MNSEPKLDELLGNALPQQPDENENGGGTHVEKSVQNNNDPFSMEMQIPDSATGTDRINPEANESQASSSIGPSASEAILSGSAASEAIFGENTGAEASSSSDVASPSDISTQTITITGHHIPLFPSVIKYENEESTVGGSQSSTQTLPHNEPPTTMYKAAMKAHATQQELLKASQHKQISSDAPAPSTTAPTTAAPPPQPKRQRVTVPVAPVEPRIFYSAEEENGRVRFLVVSNDNSERSLVWLVNLKEIFAKQLPKMPREYIVRLLFDRQHHSLLCLEGDQVVGGISFKPYSEQRFGEIAFCAVSSTHQVKGYGTRLMNHLKEYVKRIGLTHFLTYADNFATGYFKKQGFSASISMPRERWFGYIKDYDGGTLMECVVHPQIDYFSIQDLIKRQKAYLLEKIAESKTPEIVYPGLSVTRIDDPYSQIPGLREAGWVKPVLTASGGNNHNAQNQLTTVASIARALVSGVIAGSELQIVLKSVVDQVAVHKDSWPFLEPVPASVTDYLEIVKEPIDLSLIRKRLLNGVYKTAGHLRRDLQLMLDNCKIYNRPETTFYKAALGLQKLVNDVFGEIPPAAE